MTVQDAEALFDGYAAAFSRFDVDAICALWAYPAYFVARGKRAALDQAAFRTNTQALCDFYRTQAMAQAKKRVASFTPLTASTAAAVTEDVLTDAAGAEIARWRHGYLLSDTDVGIKVVAALPDAELDAWESRGAKLGSW